MLTPFIELTRALMITKWVLIISGVGVKQNLSCGWPESKELDTWAPHPQKRTKGTETLKKQIFGYNKFGSKIQIKRQGMESEKNLGKR